jgi:uncharacterized coiled-coil protein SlyX
MTLRRAAHVPGNDAQGLAESPRRGYSRRMESRLTDLEVRYAYLERAVSDLDKIAVELRCHIEKLQREFSTFRDVVLEVPQASPANEKPPHY